LTVLGRNSAGAQVEARLIVRVEYRGECEGETSEGRRGLVRGKVWAQAMRERSPRRILDPGWGGGQGAGAEGVVRIREE